MVFRMRQLRTRRAPLRIAHITDAHVSALDAEPGRPAGLSARYGDRTDSLAGLQRIFSSASRRGATLAVITGDLTDHGTPHEFRQVRSAIAAAPMTVMMVPGNHDHQGHRHEPNSDDEPRGGGFLGTATTARYEQEMGPRWWSADVGGAHFLALDWFSAWCGIDHAEQQRFAVADLTTRVPGSPVVVLSHDQPDEETMDLIRQESGQGALLAVLTGHWHASAHRTVSGCHFLSTPAATVGGLDWSAPQFRMLTIRGTALSATSLEPTWEPTPGRSLHQEESAGSCPQIVFEGRQGSLQHLGNLVAVGVDTVVPTTSADGHGCLTRVNSGTGQVWAAEIAGEPLTGLIAHDGRVAATSVAGAVTTLDANTGQRLWERQIPDRSRRHLIAAPAISPAGDIIVGDISGFACLDASSGDLRWETPVLGPRDTLLTYGTPAVTPDLAVLPLGGPARGLTALRLTDGTIAWSEPPGTPPPSSSLINVADGDALLLRTLGPTLERFQLATGHLRWRVSIPGRFSTAAPVVISDSIILVTGDGIMYQLDAGTGAIIRSQQLSGLRSSYGPYRSTGAGAPTSPLNTPGGPIIILLDGTVWHLGTRTASPKVVSKIPGYVTTQPVLLNEETIAVLTTDAVLYQVRLPGRPITTDAPDLAS
jgi:outer membrane protein assembly factor BamB